MEEKNLSQCSLFSFKMGNQLEKKYEIYVTCSKGNALKFLKETLQEK